MDRILKYILAIAFFVLSPIAVGSVFAQDARLHFENLNYLESRARDVVEVNVDGKLLDLAKRVTAKSGDPDAKKVAQAIEGLKGIYVRVYRFANEGEYNPADVDQIRAQLNAPGWERVANVRSKRNNQKVDVYTMFTGEMMSGVAVVISESKSIAVVNIIGPIDIDMLVQLGGKMNIPNIDIERENNNEIPREE
jgi:enhancing lycopene biosynthesis protein 2